MVSVEQIRVSEKMQSTRTKSFPQIIFFLPSNDHFARLFLASVGWVDSDSLNIIDFANLLLKLGLSRKEVHLVKLKNVETNIRKQSN